MEVTKMDLIERYSEMESEELIRLHLAGGLSQDGVEALEEVLRDRNINIPERKSIEQDVLDEEGKIQSLSSIGKRFLAYILDVFLALLLFGMLITVLGKSSNTGEVVGLFCFIVYFLLRDALPGGQSIGKRVFRIAVVNKVTGKPCKHTESIVRNTPLLLVWFIDLLTLGSKYKQRLGDMLANTIVIKPEGRSTN